LAQEVRVVQQQHQPQEPILFLALLHQQAAGLAAMRPIRLLQDRLAALVAVELLKVAAGQVGQGL
jgi:hypothetical protein